MDANGLVRDLDTFSACSGSTLNLEQRASLGPSLTVLQEENGFARVQLWGKVTGEAGDYLIAQAFNAPADDKRERSLVSGADAVLVDFFDAIEDIPKRNFRLGADGVSWVPLPDVNADVVKQNQAFESFGRNNGQIWTSLTGNPANKFPYQVVIPPEPKEPKPEPAEGEEEAPAEEEEEAGPKIEDLELSEELRLAYLVQCIDQDCSVVPKGAFVLNSSRQVVKNSYFAGLNASASANLNNYCHLRRATALPASTALDREALDKSKGFLDSLDLDTPKGAWSVVQNSVSATTAVRSLLWPGYVAFSVANTPNYGALYIGNGEKNVDIAFML